MVRDDFIALSAGLAMSTGGFGFGWVITPEPAELKLARIEAGIHWSPPPRRTLAPNSKIIDCMMVWVGTRGEGELWCPTLPPRPQAPIAVPTS